MEKIKVFGGIILISSCVGIHTHTHQKETQQNCSVFIALSRLTS